MKISEIIKVNSNYTRSINIERDFGSKDAVLSYVPTTRAVQTLDRICATLHNESTSRAWALVGPYGSGKSAFGLFLSYLLKSTCWEPANEAMSHLAKYAPQISKKINNVLGKSVGYLSIVITGSPEPLTYRLAVAMLDSAETFRGEQRGRAPTFMIELRESIDSERSIHVTDILKWVSELQSYVLKNNGKGILIIVDELGKFLEYEARHRELTDMYLLQALAEKASAANEAHLLLVVLMHQAFDQYFTNLGEHLKNEWKKVQGRFESIPYLESSEQMIRVINSALVQNLPKSLSSAVKASVVHDLKLLESSKSLTAGLANAEDIFVGCYPIHPLSLLILPALCQKVAQNERTLFSYLGSHEPHGFQDSVNRIETSEAKLGWIYPHEIYEYFILNQPGLVSDQLTHRRWAEVITAVERLGDASEQTVQLLKTIGLLNIIGSQGGLKASEDVLRLVCDSKNSYECSIKELLDRSIITYRKFNAEYRVWQGSDFDLFSAVLEQKEQIGKVDLASTLNSANVIPPLVARRHAIETGNLRYFRVLFLDSPNLLNDHLPVEPTILLLLSETPESESEFEDACNTALEKMPNVVACIVKNASSIREVVTDVIAHQRIPRIYPQISNDPVSTRELKDRLKLVQEREGAFISQILEEPHSHSWIWLGKSVQVRHKRKLQTVLSDALKHTFSRSPYINNELINRDKPSPSVNAARKKLLSAMLLQQGNEDIGFEKAPPEKTIYRSLFKSTGIHRLENDKWKFMPPGKSADRLFHVWEAIDEFVQDQSTSVRLDEILGALAKPPYGLKAGVSNILVFAYWLSKQDELALYEDGHFCPFLTQEVLDRLIKTPSSFSLQKFGNEKLQSDIYKLYYEASVLDKAHERVSLIESARALSKFMLGLPEYSKATKNISAEAQAVREKFFSSKSPVQLMFYQIPESLGFNPLIGKDLAGYEGFDKSLKGVLVELRMAYHRLLTNFEQQLKAAFRINSKEPLNRLREVLCGRYAGLHEYTIDVQGTKAFIGRLTDSYGEEGPWLLNLAGFLARKPPEKWTDDEALAVGFRLNELAEKVRELDILRVHSERHDDKQKEYELVLIRTLTQKNGQTELVAALDNERRGYLDKIVKELKSKLDSLDSEELKACAIAMLLDNDQSELPGLKSPIEDQEIKRHEQ